MAQDYGPVNSRSFPERPDREGGLPTRNASRRTLFAAAALAVSLAAGPALAQSYEVTVERPGRRMDFPTNGQSPGEATSAVVPPGKKSQCPAGRFVVTNDRFRPTDGRSVLFRDLNAPATAAPSQTTYDTIPLPANDYSFRTNDHDVVAMPNGDLVLIWGVHLRSPLNPKPGWFDLTVSAPSNPSLFGPGVRRGVMAWRSTDCGQSFQYVGEVDPAKTADGSCALPQYAKVSGATVKTPPYKNGGVDGQLVQLDPDTNRLYLMFQCVGQKQDTSQPGFVLSDERLRKTMVLMSSDEGATWQFLGWLPWAAWRYGVVPLNANLLAFGTSRAFSFGTRKADGTYQLDQTGLELPDDDWGWDDASSIDGQMGANVFAHTIVTRVPGDSNAVLLAFPSTFPAGPGPGKEKNGYRLFFYDRSNNQYASVDAVAPLAHSPAGYVMHLTAIDLGTGPILLYWYDVNTTTKMATVRGRLVTGPGEISEDFAIALPSARAVTRAPGPLIRLFGDGRFFNVGTNYWYGDYKTAGGYSETPPRRAAAMQPSPIVARTPSIFHFFPMWVEPDKTVRYAEVTVERVEKASRPHLDLTLRPKPKWRVGPPPVELSKRRVSPAERRMIEEYGLRSGRHVESAPAPRNR